METKNLPAPPSLGANDIRRMLDICIAGGEESDKVVAEGWLRSTNSKGSTLLMLCAHHRSDQSAPALLAAGADPTARDEWGNTALHFAATYNQPEMAKALMAAGALMDAQNEEGMTPLLRAVINHSPSVVAVLLEAGADPRVPNVNGVSPLSAMRASGGRLDDALRQAIVRAEVLDLEDCSQGGKPSKAKVRI